MNVIETLQACADAIQRTVNILKTKEKEFQEQDINYIIFGSNLDFDNLSHEQAVKVMLAFGGKWEKQPNNTYINYVQGYSGFQIRLWSAKPPASCKIIEEEYVAPEEPAIPAKPARILKRYKLVCKPED